MYPYHISVSLPLPLYFSKINKTMYIFKVGGVCSLPSRKEKGFNKENYTCSTLSAQSVLKFSLIVKGIPNV